MKKVQVEGSQRESFFNARDLEQKLFKKRIIFLNDSIDEELANDICKQLVYLNSLNDKLPIWLFIRSNGGSLKDALDIYDNIRFSRAPVIGLVIGYCHSAAILILQACTKRYSFPNSYFLLHMGHTDLGLYCYDHLIKILRRKKELENLLFFIDREVLSFSKYSGLISKRAGLSIKQFLELCNLAYEWTAQEMYEKSFLDGLIDSSLFKEELDKVYEYERDFEEFSKKVVLDKVVEVKNLSGKKKKHKR